MRKFTVYIFFILCGFQYPANAQSLIANSPLDNENEVKQVIQNMFIAMKQSDTILLKSCFSDKVIFQTVVNKQDGAVVKTESIQDFIKSIGKQTANSLDERIEFGQINIDPLIATAWTPYTFYFKGNYSHKGVNSFQLVKLKEGWKIQYLIDTRYK